MKTGVFLLLLVFILFVVLFYYTLQYKKHQTTEGFGFLKDKMNQLKAKRAGFVKEEIGKKDEYKAAAMNKKEELKNRAIGKVDELYSTKKQKLLSYVREKTNQTIDKAQSKAEGLIAKGKEKAQEKGTALLESARKKAMAKAEQVLAKYGINREMLMEFRNSACFKELEQKYGEKLKNKILKTARLKEADIQEIRKMPSDQIVRLFLSKLNTDRFDPKKISEILKQKASQQIDRAEEFDIDEDVKGAIRKI